MTSSGKTRLSGTDDRSKRLQEAKPHDRSQGNDSTERGRYCQRSCEAFGRRDRPDVPQRSFRYRVTEQGLRAALFFTRLYNRLLRPGLAAVLPGHAATHTPLRRAFNEVHAHLTAWINQ